MARTPLAAFLAKLHKKHRLAQGGETQRMRRSTFIAGAAALASAGAWPLNPKRDQPRIVIVGSGVAGVTCAFRLAQAGISASLFEANSHIGGRTWTLRGFFDEGQIAEHGGELISTEHSAVRALARELDLPMVDVNAAQPPGAVETFYFNGGRYKLHEAIADYRSVFDPMHDAVEAAGANTTWDHYTRAGRALDAMTAAQWIERFVPGGLKSRMGGLLWTAVTIEYGGDADMQSALNLVYMMGFESRGQFNLAGTDERFHIIGGNDQLVSRMAPTLHGAAINTGAALVGLATRPDSSYRCTFSTGSNTFDVAADHVVLALPFFTLRNVDLSGAGFSPRKTLAINTLAMGTNAKLHLQFNERLWNDLGYDGASFADTGYECTWEVSRGQRGRNGILVDFPGGTVGASFHAPAHAPATREVALRFLAQLEPLYPGITAAWNGKAFLDNWAADRWHGGSYSYYRPGQYVAFGGYELARQRNVHFCGEHASQQFQGYINGAVETGEHAAREILHDLR